MAVLRRRKIVELPNPDKLPFDHYIAYAICFSLHHHGCVCRDAGRGNACAAMLKAADAARLEIRKRELPVAKLQPRKAKG
jgi:hypothetical protein